MAEIPFDEKDFSKHSQREIFAYISKLSAYASQLTDERIAPQFSPAENVVMALYPKFKNDYQKLIDNGYMTKNGDYLKWNAKEKTQKALALYFYNLKSIDGKNHWKEIEILFTECNLRQAAQNNAISESKEYQELEKALKN